MSPRDQLKAILERHCASLAGEMKATSTKFAESVLVPARFGDLAREVAEMVHRINGSSGSLGFHSLSLAASKFEDALNKSILLGTAPDDADIRRLHGLFTEMQKIAGQTKPQESKLYNLDPAQVAQSSQS